MEKVIIEQCAREGLPLPDAIKNAPSLWPGLSLFYIAFMDLTTCRAMGNIEGPIPWLAVNAYCDAKGIRGDQRADMLYHVGSLDRTYMKYREAQIEAKKAK